MTYHYQPSEQWHQPLQQPQCIWHRDLGLFVKPSQLGEWGGYGVYRYPGWGIFEWPGPRGHRWYGPPCMACEPFYPVCHSQSERNLQCNNINRKVDRKRIWDLRQALSFAPTCAETMRLQWGGFSKPASVPPPNNTWRSFSLTDGGILAVRCPWVNKPE